MCQWFHFFTNSAPHHGLVGCYRSSNSLKKLRNRQDAFTARWGYHGSCSELPEITYSPSAPRSFNVIEADRLRNQITKRSAECDQLRNQYGWFVALPDDLTTLVPDVIGFECDGSEARLVLELIPSGTLEDPWVFGRLPVRVWVSVLGDLLAILARFREHCGTLDSTDFEDMYRSKVQRRLACLVGQPWDYLLHLDTVYINKRTLCGLPVLWPSLGSRIDRLYDTAHVTLIHGDFQLANILYNPITRSVKLVDPRGKFGRAGIFGDAKYDLAKLRHSFSGGYNHIVSDRYAVRLCGDHMTLHIQKTAYQDVLVEWFDWQVVRSGFSCADIRLIEGLLFLSMIPLHIDHPMRQLAMFGTALQLLNGVSGSVQ